MSNGLQTLNNQNKLAEWAERVADRRNSGMSVSAWCKANGVCEQTYYKWQRRLYNMAKAGSNYTFSNTAKNFNIVAKAGQVTISGNLNVTYGTEVPDVTIDKHGSTGAATISGNVLTATKAGEVTVVATKAGDDDYNEVNSAPVTITIEPKAVAVPAADTTNYIYNYEKQVYIIETSDDYTVSGNEQTNAGNYTVTVALKDKTNTEWSDNTTADKTYNFVINKATPTGTPGYTAITASGKTLADAALNIGTITPADGTIVWDLGDAQTVAANTSYSWTYTPADTANYNVLTGSITPYVKSSGGGGGGSSSYAITVEDAKNGTVSVSTKSASKGTTVTVTVDPDEGYTLETLTVTDKNGKEIELTSKGDGKYTFKMPASKVTVKASFAEDNTMQNIFVDVPADTYYYDAVLWAVKEGITDGTIATTFSPDAACTRAQMVTFLWRAAGSPEPTTNVCPFTDVNVDSYYGKAVLWAVEKGITNGTSETTFSPNATCTRAQMATFLCRMANGKPVGSTSAFTDVEADAYYAESVQWAVENGITDGTGENKFSPDATCTRAQMVTFLYRYFVK